MTMQQCRDYEKTAIDAQNRAFANSGIRAVARSVGVVADRAPLTVNGVKGSARSGYLPDSSVDGGETAGYSRPTARTWASRSPISPAAQPD